mmetsp:Transcript_7653/g.14744  ORF Transcript_7653/g.14744 Transcript_7653/m.14744 type:complete len:220 (-) Transcript_7653:110-769(-)
MDNDAVTLAMTILCLFVDTTSSLLCLYLNMLPVWGNTLASGRSLGAARNLFWAAVAIGSTVVLMVYACVLHEQRGFLVHCLMDIALWDTLINGISINMCWPLCFYRRSVLWTFGFPIEEELTEKRKMENSCRSMDIFRQRTTSQEAKAGSSRNIGRVCSPYPRSPTTKIAILEKKQGSIQSTTAVVSNRDFPLMGTTPTTEDGLVSTDDKKDELVALTC